MKEHVHAPGWTKEPQRFCPADGHPLKLQMMEGVPVDVCHECDGVWLDPGEISEIAPGFRLTDLRPPHPSPLVLRAVMTCPACRKGSLIPVYYGRYRRRFELDVCNRCAGLWLELGLMRELGRRGNAESTTVPAATYRADRPGTGVGLPGNPREWFPVLTGLPLEASNPCRIFPLVTWLLGRPTGWIFENFGVIPADVAQGEYYRFFTAMFLHANVWHLLANLFFLYTFGDNLEERYGALPYLTLYAICGVTGGLLSCLWMPGEAPRIGASGAISGLLGAYLIAFPRTRILMGIPFVRFLPIIFRVPVWVFLLVWLGTNVIGWLLQVKHGSSVYAVDYVAHLGGFAMGLVGGGGLRLWRHSTLVGAEE